MGRKIYLGLLIILLLSVVLISGCLRPEGQVTEERYALGESVTSGNVEVKVSEYVTTSTIMRSDEPLEANRKVVAGPEEVFLILHVSVKNIGEQEEKVGVAQSVPGMRRGFGLEYKGERVPWFPFDNKFTIPGREGAYSPFFAEAHDVASIPPEQSIDGWIVFVLPHDFEPEYATFKIINDYQETFRWKLR